MTVFHLNKLPKNNPKLVGDEGEGIACEYLVKKGYKILGRNYRIKFGEIDIIAKKKWKLSDVFRKNPLINSGRAIHFIEVKTIIGGNGDFFPEDKVDYRKRRKLVYLAEIWLMKNDFSLNYPHQIDVIGIMMNNVGQEPKIRHFENVVEDYIW